MDAKEVRNLKRRKIMSYDSHVLDFQIAQADAVLAELEAWQAEMDAEAMVAFGDAVLAELESA